jgi:excisionase family DNA binding protein
MKLIIDRREILGLYYTLQDAAKKLDVGIDWLKKMVRERRVPSYMVIGHRTVSYADLDTIRSLAPGNRDSWFLPDGEDCAIDIEVKGYTVEQAARETGAPKTWVEELVSTGKIPGQRIGKTYVVFEEALPIIRDTPRPQQTTRKEDVVYRTHKGNPKAVPLPDERYQAIVSMRDNDGRSFAAIGRELGLSRERISRIYATAKGRMDLLKQRGVIDADGNPIRYNGEDNAANRNVA